MKTKKKSTAFTVLYAIELTMPLVVFRFRKESVCAGKPSGFSRASNKTVSKKLAPKQKHLNICCGAFALELLGRFEPPDVRRFAADIRHMIESACGGRSAVQILASMTQ